MITECNHRESWTITIDREPGDNWPDVEVGHGRKRTMHPVRVVVTLDRGSREPVVTIRGTNYLKNGHLGNTQLHENWPGKIEWVMALAREARERLHLGPDSTEVDW